MKSPNIAQNQAQEFELITSCHFENQTSPKPTWNSQWSQISSIYLKREHHSLPILCPYFRFKKKKKKKKDFSGNPVNLDMGIYF